MLHPKGWRLQTADVCSANSQDMTAWTFFFLLLITVSVRIRCDTQPSGTLRVTRAASQEVGHPNRVPVLHHN